MSWNTPDTDGWHWLKGSTNGEIYIARFRRGAPLDEAWTVFSSAAHRLWYTAEDVAARFIYIGPIREPKP